MMQAALFLAPGKPLVIEKVPLPIPKKGEILLSVEACGVCRTDLHIQEGELKAKTPLILGHQIVGRTEEGKRLGGAWLYSTCGECFFCLRGEENLCPKAEFTGLTKPGGFADYVVLKEAYTFPLPEGDPTKLAPLLCAGLIGWRALQKCKEATSIGFFGFGSSAHLLVQLAPALHKKIFVFTKPGDQEKQRFALSLGAEWAGGSDQTAPKPLDAAIIFASLGALVPIALRAVRPGGVVVTAGIEMSPIPSFSYKELWMERRLESVAHLTREDGKGFFKHLQSHPIEPRTTSFSLNEVNSALEAIKNGSLIGSAVIKLI